MAHLGDSDLSEKGRIILLVVLTTGVVVLTSVALHLADSLWVYVSINQQPSPAREALHLALWGSIMLVLGRSRQILRTGLAIMAGALRLLFNSPLAFIRFVLRADILTVRIAFGIVPAMLRFVLGDGYDLIVLRILANCAPALRYRDALSARIAPAVTRVRAWRASLAQERTLRRAYRDEFKARYPSYHAFRAAFHETGEEQDQDKTAVDSFGAACVVLGLREDGSFTQETFKSRYRAAMKENHPDIAGANDRAAAINAAAAVIKQRKDWK